MSTGRDSSRRWQRRFTSATVRRGRHEAVKLMTGRRSARRTVAVLAGAVTQLSLTLGSTQVVTVLLSPN